MIAILGALVWYAGVNTLLLILTKTNPFYLLFAFVAYFLINVLFTIRIIRVLERQGIKATFKKTILPQYAGMLSSDVTPGRTGYMLTPVYLMNQNIDPSAEPFMYSRYPINRIPRESAWRCRRTRYSSCIVHS